MSRAMLTSDTVLYVPADYPTLQAAVDYAFSSLDLAGWKLTINGPSGVTTENVVVNGLLVGQTGPKSFVFDFDAGASLVGGFEANDAAFTVDNVTISGSGVGAFGHSHINIGSGVIWGDCSGSYHIDAEDGALVAEATPVTITGGALAHIYAFNANVAISGAGTVTLTGTPHFADAFTHLDAYASLYAAELTFNGSATGKRFVGRGAFFLAGTGDLEYFPGDEDGVLHHSIYM